MTGHNKRTHDIYKQRIYLQFTSERTQLCQITTRMITDSSVRDATDICWTSSCMKLHSHLIQVSTLNIIGANFVFQISGKLLPSLSNVVYPFSVSPIASPIRCESFPSFCQIMLQTIKNLACGTGYINRKTETIAADAKFEIFLTRLHCRYVTVL